MQLWSREEMHTEVFKFGLGQSTGHTVHIPSCLGCLSGFKFFMAPYVCVYSSFRILFSPFFLLLADPHHLY